MLKDITLGQFFPGDSLVHRLDARAKLIITILYIVALFMVKTALGYLLMMLFLGLIIVDAKIPFRMLLKSIKPLLFIIIFTGALNVFTAAGEPIWSFWVLSISKEGIVLAITMALRIILLILGTSMLTYTTSPIMLTDALEQLLSPLKKIKLPVHEVSMMMTIALRFIPNLIEETDKIMNAQKARGADFESGNLLRRAKALVPILVPLFVSAFRRADELAVAMECRCYTGGEGRTKMKVMQMRLPDYFWVLFTVALIPLIVFLNKILIFGV